MKKPLVIIGCIILSILILISHIAWWAHLSSVALVPILYYELIKEWKTVAKQIFNLVIFIIIFLIFWGPSNLPEKYNTNEQIKINESESIDLTLNEGLPKMVDKQTRIDSIKMPKDDTLIFNYTLINLDKNSSELIDGASEQLKNQVKENVKKDDSFAFFRKKNMNLVFNYQDKNGVELWSFKFWPEEYK